MLRFLALNTGARRDFVPFRQPPPPHPLFSLRSQTATSQLAGFRNIPNLNHVFSFFFRISLEPLPSSQHHVLFSPEVLPLRPHVAGIEIVPRHRPRLSCTDLAVQNTSAVLLVQSEACRQGFVTFGESSASYFPTTRFDDLRTRVACQSWQVPLTAHYDIHGACLAKHSVSVQLLQILQCNIKTALIQTESNFELRQKSRVTDLPKTWHMPSQVRRHVFK